MSKIKIQELNSVKSAMVTLKSNEAASICGGYDFNRPNRREAIQVDRVYDRPDIDSKNAIYADPQIDIVL
jgi:hypothetical protein